ncbi:MAG: AMP-binding protein [Psychroserpens sp.]|nr:AMP-binding protein [Psychroserpens sp.]
MTPTYDKIHLKFKLNGISFNHGQLKEVAYSLVKEGDPYEQVVGNFLLDWLDDHDYVLVQTSGTTGLPKTIKLKKEAMVNSAIATGDYFGLQPGDSALHCLPSRYISGKMMLVRAMILGLELTLIPPTLHPPYDHHIQYDFAAMIPLQLKNSLDRLSNIGTLIVGGAHVSKSLKEALQGLPTRVYETFGMTETISHIAVKPLNLSGENSNAFRALPNVTLSKDDRNCLVIDAPKLSDSKFTTNDLVQMVGENQFIHVGRIDNMINSGGVKVYPELIELKLQDLIEQRFFIASEEDKDFGQKVIMVVEGESTDFDRDIFSQLEKYEIPKVIYNFPKFIISETGKLQRNTILETILA